MSQSSIHIRVLASDGDAEYTVTFRNTPRGLQVSCDCGSGKYGKLCKHKLGVVLRDSSVEVISPADSEMDQIVGWIEASGYDQLIADYLEAKRVVEAAKAEFERSKYHLEKKMRMDELS